MKNKYWLILFVIIFGFNSVTSQTDSSEILLDGTVSVENKQIKNLADPTDENDAVNKAYLESILQSYDDRLAVLEEVVESLQEAGSLLVDQDGNIYVTQDYGEDTWATDNAKVVTYRDGTPIPYVANMADAFDSYIGRPTTM